MKTLVLAAMLSAGCATTCDTLKISRKTLTDGRALISWKCGDKTVEAKVKELPECFSGCFAGEAE